MVLISLFCSLICGFIVDVSLLCLVDSDYIKAMADRTKTVHVPNVPEYIEQAVVSRSG